MLDAGFAPSSRSRRPTSSRSRATVAASMTSSRIVNPSRAMRSRCAVSSSSAIAPPILAHHSSASIRATEARYRTGLDAVKFPTGLRNDLAAGPLTGETLGGFVLREIVGAGGYGDVYVAEQVGL